MKQALRKTALHDLHRKAGARLVSFAGWEMPLHYGSQVREHHAVRERAGVFDVSHMTVVEISGREAERYLRRLLANDVARLRASGESLYTPMLDESGGIIDDLIVYRRANGYRLVLNAATREDDLAWLARQGESFVVTVEERRDTAMLAIQGPAAVSLAAPLLAGSLPKTGPGLARFHAAEDGTWFVGRTGYTGEDGLEVILPEDEARVLWQALTEAGVAPAGLAARDTLRLEAGLNLYGADMDRDHSPLTSNIAWTVAFEPADRDFLGRNALEVEWAEGPGEKLTGVVMEARGVLRRHQRLETSAGIGEITSGVYSPTLGHSVALARVPRRAKGGAEVTIRGRRLPVRLVRPPFLASGPRSDA